MSIELVLLAGVRYLGSEVTGARLRGLLALLAADPRAGCGTARLVDALWPDERPAHPTKALQVLISRARTRLGPDIIASTPSGYRLTLADEQIDASAVLSYRAESESYARDGDHAAALARADAGIALCASAANWSDADPDPLGRLRASRLPAYRALVRSRALALSRLGRRAAAIGPLAELVDEHPMDEELLAELLRCEAASRGPATALARYDAYRQALRDELGGDPGTALRAVHAELLRDDQPVVRRGVRHDPNPLLGRDADVAAVTGLLRTARVTSIVGPGGLGKTRLAHAVGRAAEQRAVHFVALAGVTTDADVVGEVASALDVGELGGRGGTPHVVAGIVTALGPGPSLLVLDNCEHVVPGVADLVGTLVSLSADLRVLTTSRAPLGLSSESVYALPELSVATSVELFGQRALAARSGVDLPPATVRELCGHLDGLPLAVELAAARVRVMSVDEIARRIDDRFALLRGGARDAPQRHRTLHAVIDWSWQLLAPAGRAAMRALSIFPGGFGVAGARRVVGGDDVLSVLEQLVDQSLLQVVDTESGTRFRMLETVREFAAASRDDAGETDAVIARFLAWARDFGVARPESIFTRDLVPFAVDTRIEQDNLMQALRYGLDRADGATVAAVSAVLDGLWIIESNFARIGLAGDTGWVLSHYRPAPELVDVTRTALVLCAVSMFLIQGVEPIRVLATLRQFPAGPPDTVVGALQIVFGAVTGGLDELAALCDDAEPYVAGFAACVASYAREADNDLDGALEAARRMLAVFADGGSPWIQAVAHARVGELCLQVEPGESALRHVGVALAAVEKLGAGTSVARARWALVLASLQRGAVDETEQALAEATRTGTDEAVGLPAFDLAVRAEIHIARGAIDAGLAAWRAASARLRAPDGDVVGQWAVEAQSVCVVAHARYGRLDLVADVVALLPGVLTRMITSPTARPAEFPACGAVVLALAMTDLGRDHRLAARMIALAERLRYLRGFQPTMAAAAVRRAAEQTDWPAYDDAVSSYAGLDHAGLRAAVLATVDEHLRLTAADPV